MTRRLLCAVVATHALLACTWCAPAAHADVAGGGAVGPGGLQVHLYVATAGGPPVPAGSASAWRPYSVVAQPSSDRTSPLAGLCSVPGGPPGIAGWGWIWIVTTIDNSTGAIVSQDTTCVALQGQAAPGPGPSPGPPPTIGEVWRAVALPAPTLWLSPVREGVTGLATWVWATSPTTLAIDVTIDGYRVVGQAQLTGYAFTTGDGTTTDSRGVGTASAPALQHVYDRVGTYPLSVTTTWSATVTMSGPGFAARPTPIGTALVEATHDYPVVQVRSVLIG